MSVACHSAPYIWAQAGSLLAEKRVQERELQDCRADLQSRGFRQHIQVEGADLCDILLSVQPVYLCELHCSVSKPCRELFARLLGLSIQTQLTALPVSCAYSQGVLSCIAAVSFQP